MGAPSSLGSCCPDPSSAEPSRIGAAAFAPPTPRYRRRRYAEESHCLPCTRYAELATSCAKLPPASKIALVSPFLMLRAPGRSAFSQPNSPAALPGLSVNLGRTVPGKSPAAHVSRATHLGTFRSALTILETPAICSRARSFSAPEPLAHLTASARSFSAPELFLPTILLRVKPPAKCPRASRRAPLLRPP